MNYSKSELLKQLYAMETKTYSVKHPEDVVPVLLKYKNKQQEHFIVITLNGASAIIKTRVITKGLLNRALVHPREVFRPAIADNAMAIIIAHNHPSGNSSPSPEDKNITERLKQAGDVLGIQVLDHIIISKSGHYSFVAEGNF